MSWEQTVKCCCVHKRKERGVKSFGSNIFCMTIFLFPVAAGFTAHNGSIWCNVTQWCKSHRLLVSWNCSSSQIASTNLDMRLRPTNFFNFMTRGGSRMLTSCNNTFKSNDQALYVYVNINYNVCWSMFAFFLFISHSRSQIAFLFVLKLPPLSLLFCCVSLYMST